MFCWCALCPRGPRRPTGGVPAQWPLCYQSHTLSSLLISCHTVLHHADWNATDISRDGRMVRQWRHRTRADPLRPGPSVPTITLACPLAELGPWSLTPVGDGADRRPTVWIGWGRHDGGPSPPMDTLGVGVLGVEGSVSAGERQQAPAALVESGGTFPRDPFRKPPQPPPRK